MQPVYDMHMQRVQLKQLYKVYDNDFNFVCQPAKSTAEYNFWFVLESLMN